MSADVVIRVENLSKKFSLSQPQTDEEGRVVNELWALKDVSFEVRKGESVGIIGHNGSGKSTLLKILAGITKPTTGKVEIHGRVASILDIGAGFDPELSGRENIFISAQTLLGYSRKEIRNRFHEIVSFSGIERFIDEPVKHYSNGMYLRLAFSIMTHLDFDMYLLDEVLGVGDSNFQQKCIRKINELIRLQKTFVVVYHNSYLADMVISREIDLRLINSISRNFDETKEVYSNELILEDGNLSAIHIPLSEIKSKEKITKVILVIKSTLNKNLATTQILDLENMRSSANLEIDINVKLTSGSYFLNLYDNYSDSLIPIYSVLVRVPKRKGIPTLYTDKLFSVLLLDANVRND